MKKDTLKEAWVALKETSYFPTDDLQYEPQWRLFNQAAGRGIYGGIQDVLDFRNPYNFILGTEVCLITRALSKAKIILDLGCGMGHPAAHIARPGRQIVCVDRASKMICLFGEELKTVPANISLVQCDASLLSFGSGKFDLVYLCASLSSMENPQKSLYEVRRVLKPLGNIVILEPNIHHLVRNGLVKQSMEELPSGGYLYRHQEVITEEHLLITFECELESVQCLQELCSLEERDASLLSSPVIREYGRHASAYVEWRFSPSKLEYMLEAAGFQSAEVYGYGFFKDLMERSTPTVISSEAMKHLCELEASFAHMLDPSKSEMIYCKACAPGGFNGL